MNIASNVNGTGSTNNDIIQHGIVTRKQNHNSLILPYLDILNITICNAMRCNAFLYFYFLYFFILLLFFGCQIKQYLKSYLYYWRSFNYVTLFISIGIINPYKLLNT